MEAAQRWWRRGGHWDSHGLGVPGLLSLSLPQPLAVSPRGFLSECNSFYCWLVYENWQDHGPRSYGQGPWKIIGHREESVSCNPWMETAQLESHPGRPCISHDVALVAPKWGSCGPGVWERETEQDGFRGLHRFLVAKCWENMWRGRNNKRQGMDKRRAGNWM